MLGRILVCCFLVFLYDCQGLAPSIGKRLVRGVTYGDVVSSNPVFYRSGQSLPASRFAGSYLTGGRKVRVIKARPSRRRVVVVNGGWGDTLMPIVASEVAHPALDQNSLQPVSVQSIIPPYSTRRKFLTRSQG